MAGASEEFEVVKLEKAIQEVGYKKFLRPWARICSFYVPECCFKDPKICETKHGAGKDEAKPTNADERIRWNFVEGAIHHVMYKIRDDKYPPPTYIQKMLHYLMDLWSGMNITYQGISCIHSLLKKHPPCASGMFAYYKDILFGPPDTTDTTFKEECFNRCLQKIENEIKRMKNPEDSSKQGTFDADNKELPVMFPDESDRENATEPQQTSAQRLFLLLRMFVDIFESDLLSGLTQNLSNVRRYIRGQNRPLVSFVFWGRYSWHEIGYANWKCKEFIEMYLDLLKYSPKREYAREFERILSMTGEVVYGAEINPSFVYPHVDEKCERLANMWVTCILQAELDMKSVSEILNSLRPDWVQLCVSRRIFEHLVEQPVALSLRPMISYLRDLSLIQIDEHNPRALILTFQKNYHCEESSTVAKYAGKRNNEGETRLHVAVRNNCTAEMEKILSTPAININVMDNLGWTPLNRAAYNGSVECLKLLLNYRTPAGIPAANPYKRNNEGITPLMNAVFANKQETAAILAAYGGKDLVNVPYKGRPILEHDAVLPEMKSILQGAPDVGIYNLMHRISKDDQAKMLHILPFMIRAYVGFSEVPSVLQHLAEGNETSIERGNVCLQFNYMKWKQDHNDFKQLQKVIKEYLEDTNHPLYEELIFLNI